MSRPNRPATRRGTELLFVFAATLIVACAEAFVEITRSSKLSDHVVTYPLVVLAIGLACHLAIRRTARYADPLLLPCAMLLVGLAW